MITYESSGEISFAFSSWGTMSILFEQGRSFQPPYEDTMEELQTENLPGIMNFFELPIPAYGHVRDAATGLPVAGAELRSLAFAWNYGEYVTTSSFGRFHMWVPTGAWQVSVTAPGYADVVVDVEASQETGVEAEILLTAVEMPVANAKGMKTDDSMAVGDRMGMVGPDGKHNHDGRHGGDYGQEEEL